MEFCKAACKNKAKQATLLPSKTAIIQRNLRLLSMRLSTEAGGKQIESRLLNRL